jgi:hypothetical protein
MRSRSRSSWGKRTTHTAESDARVGWKVARMEFREVPWGSGKMERDKDWWADVVAHCCSTKINEWMNDMLLFDSCTYMAQMIHLFSLLQHSLCDSFARWKAMSLYVMRICLHFSSFNAR